MLQSSSEQLPVISYFSHHRSMRDQQVLCTKTCELRACKHDRFFWKLRETSFLLFVVRVAGNVVSPEIFGSLQYAGTHLKTQLFMVLGHEGCGAVQAALAAKLHGEQERSRIQLLVQSMLPGLDEVDPQTSAAAKA